MSDPERLGVAVEQPVGAEVLIRKRGGEPCVPLDEERSAVGSTNVDRRLEERGCIAFGARRRIRVEQGQRDRDGAVVVRLPDAREQFKSVGQLRPIAVARCRGVDRRRTERQRHARPPHHVVVAHGKVSRSAPLRW